MMAETARRMDGAVLKVADDRKRALCSRVLLGACWVVTPWTSLVNTAKALVGPSETFGPIISQMAFAGDDGLVRAVERSAFGLREIVFADVERGLRIAGAMTFGSVVVDDHSNVSQTYAPLAGVPGRVVGRHAPEPPSTLKTTARDLDAPWPSA